jgi:chromosome segregation ATPase
MALLLFARTVLKLFRNPSEHVSSLGAKIAQLTKISDAAIVLLKSEKETLDTKNWVQARVVTFLMTKIEGLEMVIASLTHEKNDLSLRVTLLTGEWDKARRELDDERKRQNGEKEEIRKGFEQEIGKLEDENSRLVASLRRVEKQNEEFEEEKARLENENSELITTKRAVEEERKRLEKEKEEFRRNLEQVQEELEEEKKNYSGIFEEKLEGEKKEISVALKKETLELLREHLKTLEQQLKETQEKHKKLQLVAVKEEKRRFGEKKELQRAYQDWNDERLDLLAHIRQAEEEKSFYLSQLQPWNVILF